MSPRASVSWTELSLLIVVSERRGRSLAQQLGLMSRYPVIHQVVSCVKIKDYATYLIKRRYFGTRINHYVFMLYHITDGTETCYTSLYAAVNDLQLLAMNRTLDVDILSSIYKLNTSTAIADSSVTCSTGMVPIQFYCSKFVALI